MFFSLVSSWEIAIKYARGTLPLPEPPAKFIPPRLVRDSYSLLSIRHEHVLDVATLPMHHRDPFDRLLIAQATRENLTLLTADRNFRDYKVRTIVAI